MIHVLRLHKYETPGAVLMGKILTHAFCREGGDKFCRTTDLPIFMSIRAVTKGAQQ